MILPRTACFFLGLAAGCSPAITLDTPDDSDDGPGATTSGTGGSTPSNPTAAPPVPPATTSPGASCTPGEIQDCACPGNDEGVQVCDDRGLYGPCGCEGSTDTAASSTGSVSTSGDDWGSSGWGSSGWGSSSGDGGGDNYIPELPPGETCLPLGMACEGYFDVHDVGELAALAPCSRIDGSVHIQPGFKPGSIADLDALSCLQQVDGAFEVEDSGTLVNARLESLVSAEVVVFFNHEGLVSLELPSAVEIDVLAIVQNTVLQSFDAPGLANINELFVLGNPQLSSCEVVEFVEAAMPTFVDCLDNLEDACFDACATL